ncbi:MAG: hypothetical protein HOW73_27375 [Polyangiaceae bacterium]|nr:hypothetical protein [Polyangiaceae bacterium]
MKYFLVLAAMGLFSCADDGPTFQETCDRLVAECSVPEENLANCYNHGWDTMAAAQEGGCEDKLDEFLVCANESELFCGVLTGADCHEEADALADCGAPIF